MKSKVFMSLMFLVISNQISASGAALQTLNYITDYSTQRLVAACTLDNLVKCSMIASGSVIGAIGIAAGLEKAKEWKKKFFSPFSAHVCKGESAQWIGDFPEEFTNKLLEIKANADLLNGNSISLSNAYCVQGKKGAGKTTLVKILSEKLSLPLVTIQGSHFAEETPTDAKRDLGFAIKAIQKSVTQSPFNGIVFIDQISESTFEENFCGLKFQTFMEMLKTAISDPANKNVLFVLSSVTVMKNQHTFERVHVTLPNEHSRRLIISRQLAGKNIQDGTSTIESLIKQTEGFTVPQIKQTVETALRTHVLSKNPNAQPFFRTVEEVIAQQKDAGSKKSETNWIGQLPESLETLLKQTNHYKELKECGLAPSNGFLLHGKPGTGKTLAVRELAKRLNLPLIETNSGQFMGAYQGSANAKLEKIMQEANTHPERTPFKCIVFIDELDGFKRHRGSSNGEEDRFMSDLLSILTNKENESILFIGATNYIEEIDEALKRSGRLVPLEMELPNDQTRMALVCGTLERLKHELDQQILTLEDIVSQTKGFSHADIISLLEKAAMQCIIDDRAPALSFTKHLEIALKKQVKKEATDLSETIRQSMYS